MAEVTSGAIPADSTAADLAELIYERWMASLADRRVVDFAAVEALVILVDGLRFCEASDEATGVDVMRSAIGALARLPADASPGALQSLVTELLVRQRPR